MSQFYKKYVLFSLLLSSFAITAMEQGPEQLLRYIQQNQDILYIGQSLLKTKNKDDKTVLHFACKQGDVDSIKKIFRNRTNHDSRELLFSGDRDGFLGIHEAAKNGHAAAITTLVDIRIQNGRDPQKLIFHHRNRYGKTPLHCAVIEGHIQATKTLIDTSDNKHLKKFLFMQMHDRYTTLHLAAINGRAEIAEILLKAAGDSAQELASVYAYYGQTAIHCTIAWGKVVADRIEGYPDVLKIFIQTFGYNILHLKQKDGYTVLQYAAKLNRANINAFLSSLNVECTLCLETKNCTELYTMSSCNEQSGCKSSFCKACLIDLITTHLAENSTRELKCPNISCAKKIDASDVCAITQDRKDLFARFLEISFDEFKINNQNYIKSCPTPDCECTYSIEGIDGTQQLQCPSCNHVYCVTCQYDHENMTCADAATMDHDCPTCVTRHARNMSCQAAARDRVQTRASLEELRNQHVKPCPNCKIYIEKSQGCNHITCKRCSHEFCWTCLSAFRATRCNSGWCDVLKIETGIDF